MTILGHEANARGAFCASITRLQPPREQSQQLVLSCALDGGNAHDLSGTRLHGGALDALHAARIDP
jgi:hypothetical protein